MRRLSLLVIFISLSIILAVGVHTLTQLTLAPSLAIGGLCGILIYLMMDLRPEADPGDATIIRLTKGTWHRKRR